MLPLPFAGRIRRRGLQLVATGLDRGVLVLDLVGPGGMLHLRAPAGVFLDRPLLEQLDRWERDLTPLRVRARRRRDGRLDRLRLDDGVTCARILVRRADPVSGRTARRRPAPAPAPAGGMPPGSG